MQDLGLAFQQVGSLPCGPGTDDKARLSARLNRAESISWRELFRSGRTVVRASKLPIFGHTNPQRLQKIHIVGRKRSGNLAGLASDCFFLVRVYFVQANRRFQHQQHIESLFANAANHHRNILRLRH